MSDWIGVSLQLVITLEYKDANLAFQLGAIEGKELNSIKEHLQSTLALRTPRYNGHPDNTDSS